MKNKPFWGPKSIIDFGLEFVKISLKILIFFFFFRKWADFSKFWWYLRVILATRKKKNQKRERKKITTNKPCLTGPSAPKTGLGCFFRHLIYTHHPCEDGF